MKIMAIDPGNTESAYVIMDGETCKPLYFAKVPNASLLSTIFSVGVFGVTVFVIERVACYGMPVGREVFDTCEWIGRFSQAIKMTYDVEPEYVFRMEEKQAICHDARAGDSNITRALIDRFAKNDLRSGKGTKKNPDFFYGFHHDIWAAFAVGYTWLVKSGFVKEVAS